MASIAAASIGTSRSLPRCAKSRFDEDPEDDEGLQAVAIACGQR